jgi:alpha/beta superfamily hydrolase
MFCFVFLSHRKIFFLALYSYNMRSVVFQGTVGRLEGRIYTPSEEAAGICFVTHPHSLFGGSMDNKVVHCLNQCFQSKGYITVLHNCRGVGKSEGAFDNGIGEADDLEAVCEAVLKDREILARLPRNFKICAAGFSFGTYVINRLLSRRSLNFAVLVGCAPNKWVYSLPGENCSVIHGAEDEVAPLDSVFRWLEPGSFPVTVIPGASHFFDRRLVPLMKVINRSIEQADV